MFTYAFILTTMYFLNWTTVSERLCPVGNKIVARERALYKFYYYYYYYVKYVRTTFAYEFVYIEKKNNNFTGKSFAMLSPPVNSKSS